MDILPPDMTASELIDRLGGNGKMAVIAGVGATAVSNWRRFGAIPPRLYLRIASACRGEGFEPPTDLFRELSDEERAA